MTPYNGPDRRDNSPVLEALHEFRIDVVDRLGRIEEAAKGHEARLANHSDRIEAVAQRTKDLESCRDQARGALLTIGVPTFGTLAWLVYEFGMALKKLKGGG